MPDRTTQASGGGKDVRRGLTPPTWPALEQSSASVATLHLDGSRSAGKAKRLHTRLNRLRLLEWGQSGLPPPCCFGEAHTFVGLSGGDPADRAGLRVRAARTAEKAVGRQAPGPGVQPSEWCDRRFRQVMVPTAGITATTTGHPVHGTPNHQVGQPCALTCSDQ